MMMQNCKAWCAPYYAVVGRVFMSMLFIYAGYEKLLDLLNAHGANIVGMMQYAKIPMSGIALLVLVIAVEIIGGIMLAVGYKAKYAAGVLALFTLATTYFFHLQLVQAIEALKNFAIIGGLLYVSAYGAGMWSVDAWCTKKDTITSI
jgi:putative oxidoreductase